MKKVLIISDSHGNTKDFLKVIEKEKPDYKVHAGDFTVPISIIENNFDFFVRGNNDYEGPKWVKFKIENLEFYLTHGDEFGYGMFGGQDKFFKRIADQAKYENVKAIITGHTHIENFKIIDNVTLLNPGSIHLPRNAAFKRSYMVIHVDKDKIVETDLKQAVRYLD